MKKSVFITTIFILSCCYAPAQSKWYVSPSAGVGFMDNSGYCYTTLTVGHYFGEKKPLRMDLWGSYIFVSDNNAYSIAALVTFGDHIKADIGKWMTTASIGAGIQKSKKIDNVDFIIPLRANFGYRLTNKLSLGIEIANSFNLSQWNKGRSLSYGGAFLGIRL